LVALVLSSAPAIAQQGARNGEWRSYAADGGSTKYSALDLINRDNVNKLQVAWRWSSPELVPAQSFQQLRSSHSP